MVPTSETRAARLATFAFFVLNGVVMGAWAVHIPVLARRASVGPGTLGWLLLLLGGSAFAGMQLAGPLTDRLGPRRVVPAAALLCGSSLIPLGLVHSVWTLGGAVCGLGFANGCLDVSMNTHAVAVERDYPRPIMAAFHAAWSLGGVLASAVGAWTIARDWPPVRTFACVAIFVTVGTALASRSLLPLGTSSNAPATAADLVDPNPAVPGSRTRRLWFLATLAFAVMLCEGVAYDWSTTHARTVLHASASTAALAYGAYATAATLGRLTVDRVAARVGPGAVVGYGAGLAAIGLLLAALAPDLATAVVAWVLIGLGLSGCVPQLFTAAGALDPATAGTNVARVAGLGYLGMLAGPAVIGALTHVVALNTAFVLPAVLCSLAAFGGSAALAKPAAAESRLLNAVGGS